MILLLEGGLVKLQYKVNAFGSEQECNPFVQLPSKVGRMKTDLNYLSFSYNGSER